jgi:Raf kinase inhibitor-like YbhB/YbcL family protein
MRRLAALVVLSMLPILGCQSSGRELREPAPGVTAPPRRAPQAGTVPSSSTTLGTVFALTTDAWAPGGEIPREYTCDGEDLSPPLVMSLIPPGTVELAIVVTDPDANNFVHWVLAGIDPATTTIEEGSVPAGAVQAQTSDGTVGWSGPCPPGGATHTYIFELYALGQPSAVTEGEASTSAVERIEAVATVRSQFTGTYER